MSSLHIHPATTSTAERIMVAIGIKQQALVRVERVDGAISVRHYGGTTSVGVARAGPRRIVRASGQFCGAEDAR